MEQAKKHSRINDYVLGKTLGSGYNSIVKLGMDTRDGQYYAIKIIRDTSHIDSNIKAILNETKVLKNLDHPNIIKLKEVKDDGEYVRPDGTSKSVMFAAIQLAENGEIFEYLANTGRFSEPVARYYFKQLIEALEYCHNQGYAHRDLKPENILLDKNFNLLLADFGFATILSGKDGSGKLKSILGTESYMAPEIHSKAPYIGTSVDLFAAGIILFIFITGHPAFNQAKATDSYYQLICMNNHQKFWTYHSRKKPNGINFFSEEFMNLMNALLAFDPTQRPSIAEIKSHKWYNGETSTAEQIHAEFSARKANVEQMLAKQKEMAEKKRKIAEMRKRQNQGAQNIGYEGIAPKFRSEGVEEENPLEDHEIEELKDLQLKKDLPVFENDMKNNAYVSFLTPIELYKAGAIASNNITKNIEVNKEEASVNFYFILDQSYSTFEPGKHYFQTSFAPGWRLLGFKI